jgi:hypothetical protein
LRFSHSLSYSGQFRPTDETFLYFEFYEIYLEYTRSILSIGLLNTTASLGISSAHVIQATRL